MRIIHAQPSWRIASSTVEAFVTQRGGHVAPVVFDRMGRKITPYSIAPWAEEKLDPKTPAIIKVLRGDFFCLPFGGNAASHLGEKHPVHGETANAKWHLESEKIADNATTLHLSLKTKIRAGRVDKEISLVDGENVVYSRHTLSGMSGPMNFGHHAMLKFPDHEGSGLISTSRFLYGQVFPETFEQAETGGYSALKQGAEFDNLESVPLAAGGNADLSRYPARRGFEDLVMMVSDAELPFAWTAVVFSKERYVWFALKDPKILRETVFWISNRGRHYAPWSSRHVNVMGIEDVTSYFHFGLAESCKPNPISGRGWPTSRTLNQKTPLIINYIMGVAPIPSVFDRVESIVPGADEESIILQDANGRTVTAKVDIGFLDRAGAAK